jgi:hypothetical protein
MEYVMNHLIVCCTVGRRANTGRLKDPSFWHRLLGLLAANPILFLSPSSAKVC